MSPIFLLSPMHARFILTGGFQLVFQQSLQKGSHFQSSHYSVLLFHSSLRGYWSVNCSEMRITWITLYPWSCICISTLIHDIAIHWTKNDKDVFCQTRIVNNCRNESIDYQIDKEHVNDELVFQWLNEAVARISYPAHH